MEGFDFYRREFERDPHCFADRECVQNFVQTAIPSRGGGALSMETRYAIQYRWVDTAHGRMVLHRFWLKERADGDSLDVKMHANYYIGITMDDVSRPTATARTETDDQSRQSDDAIDGAVQSRNSSGSLRVHANWFSIDQPNGDDFALEQLIQTQISDSRRLDTWLSDHPEMVTCP